MLLYDEEGVGDLLRERESERDRLRLCVCMCVCVRVKNVGPCINHTLGLAKCEKKLIT